MNSGSVSPTPSLRIWLYFWTFHQYLLGQGCKCAREGGEVGEWTYLHGLLHCFLGHVGGHLQLAGGHGPHVWRDGHGWCRHDDGEKRGCGCLSRGEVPGFCRISCGDGGDTERECCRRQLEQGMSESCQPRPWWCWDGAGRRRVGGEEGQNNDAPESDVFGDGMTGRSMPLCGGEGRVRRVWWSFVLLSAPGRGSLAGRVANLAARDELDDLAPWHPNA